MFSKEMIVQKVVLQSRFSVHFEKNIKENLGESNFGQDPIQICVTIKCGKFPNSFSPEQF